VTVLASAVKLQREGTPFVLATVTWRRGPSSGKGGSKAIVHADGRVEGWLGGACAEPTVVRQALEALGDGEARLLVLGEHDHRPGVTNVSMACASEGAMEVYVEPMLPVPGLFIVGSSPMVDTLRRLAAVLGWDVESTDDPAGLVGRVGERSYVVVASQGHYDEPALEAALATPAAYIGLVASEKRAAAVRAWLRDRGVADEALARLRAPAGVDLGPTEHHEIAVAILAELVAEKAAGAGAQVVQVEMPAQAIDPVCGMTVDPATARFSTVHEGTTVYFCAAGCQAAFEANPEMFPLR
jgi:xanthine dehydrogenase accessory factor